MNIIIIYPNAFPIGGSATNRTLHIAKALHEEGNTVKVLIVRPTEKKNRVVNKLVSGIYDNIKFEYTTNNLIWPTNKIKKLLYLFVGLIKTIVLLYKYNNENKIDCIISSAYSELSPHIVYYIICKLLNIKLISAIDEYPWVLINKEKYNKVYSFLYLKLYYKLFDGFIIMTNILIKYYKNKINKKAKIFHLPMTVEINRFLTLNNVNITKDEYIAYSGWDVGVKDKDGIEILINSFKLISMQHPNIKLYLIGKFQQKRINQIESLSLKDKIIFTGPIHREKIPEYFFNAKALLLSRPQSIQAEGGFPTKLGEYLASATPVIVTKVGEISYYLEDNLNAFLVEPNDPKLFADKVNYVLEHPELAKRVGLNGQKLAAKVFNYRTYRKSLNNFLYNV